MWQRYAPVIQSCNFFPVAELAANYANLPMNELTLRHKNYIIFSHFPSALIDAVNTSVIYQMTTNPIPDDRITN